MTRGSVAVPVHDERGRAPSEGNTTFPAARACTLPDLLPALSAAGVAMALFDTTGRLTAATPAVRQVLTDDPEWAEVWRAARTAAEGLHRSGTPRGSNAPPLLSEREVRTKAATYRLIVSGPGGASPAWAAVIFDRQLLPPRADEAPSPTLGLSAREHQVARLLATGQTTASAGAALGISAHTARRHAERVYAKLGVHNRAALGALLARVDDGTPATPAILPARDRRPS